MKAFLLFGTLGLATFTSAITAEYEDDLLYSRAVNEYEDDLLFSRAVNDKCKAPLGRGTCQHTANCPGVSYPTGLCPKDPKDVQVRLTRGYMSRVMLMSHHSAVIRRPAMSPRLAQVTAEVLRIMAVRAENFTLVFARGITISDAVSRTPRSHRRHQSLPRPIPARSLHSKSLFSKIAYLPSWPPSAHRALLVLSGQMTAAAVHPMILASSTLRLPAGATTSDTGIRRSRAASMTR